LEQLAFKARVKKETAYYDNRFFNNLNALGFEAPTIAAKTEVVVIDYDQKEGWAMVKYPVGARDEATVFVKVADLQFGS
jgi:hypothetical protein